MSRRDEKTTQILHAATAEFANKGLDAASMHHIAEVAEVSKRTLYKYYPSKEELFQALVDELLDRVYEMYQISYDPEKPFKLQLEQIAHKKIEFITSESFISISRIVIGEMIKSKKITESQAAKLEASDALFVKWIDDAKEDGKITSSTESSAMAGFFHHLLKGDVFWPLLLGTIEKEAIDTNQVVERTVDFFISSFCE